MRIPFRGGGIEGVSCVGAGVLYLLGDPAVKLRVLQAGEAPYRDTMRAVVDAVGMAEMYLVRVLFVWLAVAAEA